ncbi:MAG: type II toxin-antitoxin system RelE/ParE family toxin [Patescibacteria group bacterium]
MKVEEIKYSSHFLRALKKLPKSLKSEILKQETIFRENRLNPKLKTHKLKGELKGFWAFSITKSYRIMFAIEDNGVISFIDVGDHDIYS